MKLSDILRGRQPRGYQPSEAQREADRAARDVGTIEAGLAAYRHRRDAVTQLLMTDQESDAASATRLQDRQQQRGLGLSR